MAFHHWHTDPSGLTLIRQGPGSGMAFDDQPINPRVVGTHVPAEMLPPSVLAVGARVVYLV